MTEEYNKRKRHLLMVQESRKLLWGLSQKETFSLRLSDDIVSSDKVVEPALPLLAKQERKAKKALLGAFIRGIIQWGPEIWGKTQEIVGLLL